MRRLFPPAQAALPTVELHPAHLRLVGFPEEVMVRVRKAFSWDIPGTFFAAKSHREKHPVPQSWCSACQSDGKRCLLEGDNLPRGFGEQLHSLLWQITAFGGAGAGGGRAGAGAGSTEAVTIHAPCGAHGRWV